jgi:hypothetical protein
MRRMAIKLLIEGDSALRSGCDEHASVGRPIARNARFGGVIRAMHTSESPPTRISADFARRAPMGKPHRGRTADKRGWRPPC